MNTTDSDNWSSLIDFSKVPGGYISVKTASEIEELAKTTINNTEINTVQKQPEQYPELDKEIRDELDRAENILKNKNTTIQTEHYVKMFKTHGLPSNIENMPVETLDSYLRYFSIRTERNQTNCIRQQLYFV